MCPLHASFVASRGIWPRSRAAAAVLLRRKLLSHRLEACRHLQSKPHVASTAVYNYKLGKLPGATAHKVQLTPNGFKCPESIDNTKADTVFLEINIDQTQADVPWPSIRANRTSTKDAITHYFEPNASGRQYLDLSQLLPLKFGEEVELISEDGTKWHTVGNASLTTFFTNPPIRDKRVLVLSPHPDDAEIAAYGLYTSSKADIVTITAGDAGKPKFGNLWDDSGEQYRAKGRMRTIDSLVVPLLGGLKPDKIRNLGYYDGTLEDMHKNPFETVPPKHASLKDSGYFRRFNFDTELRNRPFESSWRGLVADVLEELEKTQPDIVVTPHPLLDSHKDHKFTTVALMEALKRWNRHCNIYLYNNHTTGNEAYPFGPRDGQMGLPPMDQDMIHPLYVHGLYSHPLSREIQRQKVVALETHHDLRAFDVLDGSDIIKPPPGLDYYRRAGRPNELFFVTDFAGVWGMCQQLLGQPRTDT